MGKPIGGSGSDEDGPHVGPSSVVARHHWERAPQYEYREPAKTAWLASSHHHTPPHTPRVDILIYLCSFCANMQHSSERREYSMRIQEERRDWPSLYDALQSRTPGYTTKRSWAHWWERRALSQRNKLYQSDDCHFDSTTRWCCLSFQKCCYSTEIALGSYLDGMLREMVPRSAVLVTSLFTSPLGSSPARVALQWQRHNRESTGCECRSEQSSRWRPLQVYVYTCRPP